MGRCTSIKATEADSRTDIYQRVTDRIVTAIDAALAKGKAGMPWHRTSHGGTATGLPLSAASKTSYRGVNVPLLWATADAAGYDTGLRATYKQWGEMGGQVRKGEQGTPVVYWKITKPSERGDTDGQDEAGGGKRGSFFVRYYAMTVKKAAHASEQERPDVAARRKAWFNALPDLDPEHLVFIDETGASTKMARLRGRANEDSDAALRSRTATGKQPPSPAHCGWVA